MVSKKVSSDLLYATDLATKLMFDMEFLRIASEQLDSGEVSERMRDRVQILLEAFLMLADATVPTLKDVIADLAESIKADETGRAELQLNGHSEAVMNGSDRE